MKHTSTRRRTITVSTVAAAALAAAVVAPSAAFAAGSDGTGQPVMNSTVLLTLDEVAKAGVPADTATIDSTGNQTLLSAARATIACLTDKTMRAITGAKPAPAAGTALAYYDGLYGVSTGGGAVAQTAFAQGRSAGQTGAWVSKLRQGIVTCKPANGHYYGPAKYATNGAEKLEYYLEYTAAGKVVGGAALTRVDTQFGYVALANGSEKTLVSLGLVAGQHLVPPCQSAQDTSGVAHPDGC